MKMNKVMRYSFLWLLLFFLNIVIIKGQIVSTAIFAIDSVQIGDPITVDIKVNLPQGVKLKDLDFSVYKNLENLVYQQDTNLLEKYADIEILDFGQWKHEDINQPINSDKLQINMVNGQQTIQNTITIAIYNSGVFAIPGLGVHTETPSEVLPTSPKTIQVLWPTKLAQQDTLALNPIKDIMYEDANLSDYLVYVYIVGVLILMGLVGYYFYKRKKAEVLIVPEVVEVVLPADVKALQALESLKNAQLWQKGQIKEYQTGLTDIIRTYIEERYDVKAPEMTTDEISQALQRVDFDPKFTIVLKEILQVADMVKFAKATPEEDIHNIFMEKAVDFVQSTKDTSLETKIEEPL